MRMDIILDRRHPHHRLVININFTNVFSKGRYRDQSLRTGSIYQLYAYLRYQ